MENTARKTFVKEVKWIASIYHSVKDMQNSAVRDYALELENNTKPILVTACSLKESARKFINTNEFESFWLKHKDYSTIHFYYVNQHNQIVYFDEQPLFE